MGGSLGRAHAETICELLHLAGRSGVPVVGFVESGGARLQEGHDALSGYGEIFRASVELGDLVPQISVVTGVSAGGGAYSPALTDFDRDERGGADVSDRPARGRRGDGRMGLDGRARRHRGPLAQRRLRPGRRRRGGRDRLGAGDPRVPALADRLGPRAGDPDRAGPGRPRGRRPRSGAARLRRRRGGRADLRRRLDAGARPPLGRQHESAASPGSRVVPVGVVANQPKRARRRDRRRRGREGGGLRRLAATASGCRWWSSSTPPGSCPARSRRAPG